MEDKYLKKCITQSACGERLLGVIVKELEIMKKEGYKVDKVLNMGKRLLTWDYYKEANDMLETCTNLSSDNPNFVRLKLSILCATREKCALEKRTDYSKFFDLLINNIEDWC